MKKFLTIPCLILTLVLTTGFNGVEPNENEETVNNYSLAVEYSRSFTEQFSNNDKPMKTESLVRALSRNGTLIYKGKKAIKIEVSVFVTDPERMNKRRVASKVIALKPGKHRIDEYFPQRKLMSILKRMFPDTLFFPDSTFYPDSVFFPDSTFFPDSVFSKIQKGQSGIGVAAVPVEKEVLQESKIGATVFSFNRKGGDKNKY